MTSNLSITSGASAQTINSLRVLQAGQSSSSSASTKDTSATSINADAYSLSLGYDASSQSSSSTTGLSGSLAVGLVSTQSLGSLLTSMSALAKTAADSGTSQSDRTKLQGQYNSLAAQASDLLTSSHDNGVRISSAKNPANAAKTVADLGVSTSANWTDATTAASDLASLTTAEGLVSEAVKGFATSAGSAKEVALNTASNVIQSFANADKQGSITPTSIADELTLLKSLDGTQQSQALKTYMVNQALTALIKAGD